MDCAGVAHCAGGDTELVDSHTGGGKALAFNSVRQVITIPVVNVPCCATQRNGWLGGLAGTRRRCSEPRPFRSLSLSLSSLTSFVCVCVLFQSTTGLMHLTMAPARARCASTTARTKSSPGAHRSLRAAAAGHSTGGAGWRRASAAVRGGEQNRFHLAVFAGSAGEAVG
jgi:hypothetical protein